MERMSENTNEKGEKKGSVVVSERQIHGPFGTAILEEEITFPHDLLLEKKQDPLNELTIKQEEKKPFFGDSQKRKKFFSDLKQNPLDEPVSNQEEKPYLPKPISDKSKEVIASSEKHKQIIKAHSYEEYVGALANQMLLPKNWQEVMFKDDPLKIPLGAKDVAPYVQKVSETKVILEMKNKNGENITTNSDIPVLPSENTLKLSSTAKIALLAEAEARYKAALRSDNIPDNVRYSSSGVENIIKKLHNEAENIINDNKAQKRIKTASSIGAVAIAVSACTPVFANTPQATFDSQVATRVAQALEDQKKSNIKSTATPPDYVSILKTIEPNVGVSSEGLEKTVYPQSEAFYQRDLGKITDIGVLSPDKSFLAEARTAVEKELGITPDQYGLYGFSIDGEKTDDSFVYIVDYRDQNNWKFYAIYRKDKDGFYKSIETDGSFAILPMIQGPNADGKAVWGFDIAGGYAAPIITYDTITNSVFYTDPVKGEMAKVSGEVAIKIRADLKDRFQPINVSVGDTISSELVGREGLTEEMVGTKVVEEQDLPFKFLQNSEGKKISVFIDGEWGKYLDIPVTNIKENKNIKTDDIPEITIKDVASRAWANRLKVELFKMNLNGQNMNPEKISYSIIDPQDIEGTRDLVKYDYDNFSNEELGEIRANWRIDSQIPLFPASLKLAEGKYASLLTSRISQKNYIQPYVLFNTMIFGKPASSKEIKRSFALYGPEFFNAIVFYPATKVDKNEAYFWKQIEDSGYYEYLWDQGAYNEQAKAAKLLQELAASGSTSQDINDLILVVSSTVQLQ